MSVDGSLPGVACPGVLGECCHQHDDGLVVQRLGGEPTVVEGAFELRIGDHGTSEMDRSTAVLRHSQTAIARTPQWRETSYLMGLLFGCDEPSNFSRMRRTLQLAVFLNAAALAGSRHWID